MSRVSANAARLLANEVWRFGQSVSMLIPHLIGFIQGYCSLYEMYVVDKRLEEA